MTERKIAIQFLSEFTVTSLHDFLGANGLQGGYMPLDTCGFPASIANGLVQKGKAKLTTPVDVIFQMAGGGHSAGDTANLAADVATPLIAQGVATLAPGDLREASSISRGWPRRGR